ncbi:MAG: polymer-forming cytoskeletal protein [Bacteroidales bacterium]|nr:polymer-forming cytoskeletal protein [Bacteroidales bacterium]
MKIKRKMAKTITNDSISANLIQNGTRLKGDLDANSNIRVDGYINGNVKIDGKLIVGDTGEIEGQIECKEAEVFGKIKGNLKVEGLLSLKASAHIEGDVITGRLAIESGAVFSCSCQMSSATSNETEKRKR